jgi:hypothetical protein
MSGRKRKNYDPIDPRNWPKERYIERLKHMGIGINSSWKVEVRRTTDNNSKWPKQWVMTENKSSSWCMKNTMDLEVPRGEAKFVLMCINLNHKNKNNNNDNRTK